MTPTPFTETEQGQDTEVTLRAFQMAGSPSGGLASLASISNTVQAPIAGQFVFGQRGLAEEGLLELARTEGGLRWPVMWVQGDHADREVVSGSQVFKVFGARMHPVMMNGQIVGHRFGDADADYCLLSGLLPPNLKASRRTQAYEMYQHMEATLKTVGMNFRHVARTWMFLTDLLEWYDEFNQARTQFYQECGVFEGLVPASTGIGASGPAGAALTAAVLAIKPLTSRVGVQAVASPLQCEATTYQRCFSRAVEVVTPKRRTLYVSGTASIGQDGRSLHEGDIAGQVELTMEVVESLLAAQGMTWKDTSRAVAYFRRLEDEAVFETYCRHRRLTDLPVTMAWGDICREELLFEIEVDATVRR